MNHPAIAAVEELAAELAHADALIAEQQARIDSLGRELRRLESLIQKWEAA